MKALLKCRFLLVSNIALSLMFLSCQKGNDTIKTKFSQDVNSKSSSNSVNPTLVGTQIALNLKVVTFNVLAPCWASPQYYPVSSVSKLDRVYRRNKIIAFLNQVVSSGASVIALQEVQIDEFPYYRDALQSLFEGYNSLHNDTYWSSWITVDPPFARNGNALFLRKDVFTNIQFIDKPLTDDGNHSVFATAQDKSGRIFRIASIHLDSDNSNRRNNECSAIFSSMPIQTNTIDIVAGDFNAALSNGNLSNLMRQYAFNSALDVAGISEQTHPFTTSYNRNTNWGPIDHIAYRNATIGGKISLANDGMPSIDNGVIDFNVWKVYPSGATYEADRINKNFDNCGSDHFPVTATLVVR